MSLKSFISGLWDNIKHLFEGLTPKAKWAVHLGATMVENIKNFDDSPIADFITFLIPGTVDDNVLAIMRRELPRIAVNLKLLDEATVEGLTPDEVALKLTEVVRSIDKDFKADFYDTLAVRFALAAADGELTWDEIKVTMKWYYDSKFKYSQE